jgi:PST family polysaccharide transporter
MAIVWNDDGSGSEMKVSELQARLGVGRTFRGILRNAGWISADRVACAAISVFVGIWMARYLGPKNFGVYSYVIALTGLFGIFGKMGLDDVVIREFVHRQWTESQILGTTFGLKLLGGLCGGVAAFVTVRLLRRNDPYLSLLVGIAASAMIFQASDAIGLWLQARLRSDLAFIIDGPAALLTAAARIGLLLAGGSVIAFVCVLPLAALLSAIGFGCVYWKVATRRSSWTLNRALSHQMLTTSMPLLLSTIAIAVYMRIDQVMLGSMASDKAVGIYAAAVKISEAWYFVPVAVVASAFPSLVEARRHSTALYVRRLQRLLRMLATLSYAICLMGSLLSGAIVRLVYGAGYAEAIPVLATLFWTGPVVALGIVGEKWKVIENLAWFSFFSTGLGAMVNVALNLIWIPRYGALGAAWATVVAYSLAGVLSALAFRPTRPIGWMMLKSLALVSP